MYFQYPLCFIPYNTPIFFSKKELTCIEKDNILHSIFSLIIRFVWGITSGFAVPAAQSYGKKDYDETRHTFGNGLSWLPDGLAYRINIFRFLIFTYNEKRIRKKMTIQDPSFPDSFLRYLHLT